MWQYDHVQDSWKKEQSQAAISDRDNFDSLSISAVDDDFLDDIWVTASSFTEPPTLYRGNVAKLINHDYGVKLKSTPQFFNNDGVEVEQHWVVSKDGTKVPYFVVGKHIQADKTTARPALVYGYGGFEISMTPFYGAVSGTAWMEKGGLFVLANIRGGGEFGPKWHQVNQL